MSNTFIRAQNLSFSYKNMPKSLLENVSLSFHSGWTSICGANGCGKTTLFKLLSDQLTPTSGSVQKQGTSCLVAQQTEDPPESLESTATDYSRYALTLKEALKIEEDWFHRWDTLSIGERKRVQILAALCQNPDILLVDEPTNHVDEATGQAILEALAKFRGIGLLVSHDRLLLNKLCTSTVFFDARNVMIYNAPYKTALLEFKQRAQTEKNVMERALSEKKRADSKAQAQVEKTDKGRKKKSKRFVDPKDSDARDRINLAKNTNADSGDGRKQKVLALKAERAAAALNKLSVKKEYDLGIFFGDIIRPRGLVFEGTVLTKDYLTIHQPHVSLKIGDKLAITGDNGAGKSTLMTSWMASNLPRAAVFGPQEFKTSERNALAKELLELDKEVRGKIMTLVSCFGSDPKSLAAGGTPSPGVWQKLTIAKAIVEGAPAIFLDEPTNHMDLPAVEILERALKGYKGVLVLISHDRHFIDKLCNIELRLTKTENITSSELLDIRQD